MKLTGPDPRLLPNSIIMKAEIMIADLSQWSPCSWPSFEPIQGRFVRLEPIADERHFDDLWAAYSVDDSIWDYLPYGPFADFDEFFEFARATYLGKDPMFHAVIDLETGKAAGIASLMRITPDQGVIEVGHICYASCLQRRPATTEAMYLFASQVFETLEYRRFEWKCNAANTPSVRAAERFGFVAEGVFRQHMVVKGKNRDTAWFSILDKDWPELKKSYELWLASDNFDDEGQQVRRLEECRGQAQ